MNIAYQTYFDKVYGCWYGKCLGGAAGAPVEGIKDIIRTDDFMEIMNPNLPNDDLDLQLLWLDVLERKGINTTSEDLADAWVEKCWYPFSEYGYFLKNYKRGIAPPYSGKFNNPFFKEGMGCPIRSEIWGLIFPGKPERAAEFAKMDGELDHTDNSVWAEMFLSAMESMMFTQDDVEQLIRGGLRFIPRDCRLAACICDCLHLYHSGVRDWLEIRNAVIPRYGHPDFTNVVQNLGFVVTALLLGEKDLRKTINIALKCGYDTDCTCATAGAIIGGMIGYRQIPAELLASVQDSFVIGIDVTRRSNSIKDLAEDTCRLGLALREQTETKPDLDLQVDYIDRPAIGFCDSARITVTVKNHSDTVFSGRLLLEGLPDGWRVVSDFAGTEWPVQVPAHGETVIAAEFQTSAVPVLKNSNIMYFKLYGDNGLAAEKRFGIAGASVYQAYGPFLEQLQKAPNPAHPSPHGEGCVLPTVECMVNNAVYLEKEYLDERTLDFSREPFVILNAYEDMIPFEQEFSIEGQCCFYLQQDFRMEEEKELWLVIGNNDGFIAWLNGEEVLRADEIRYWTPYNNCALVKLKKGENRLTLKLLRRTEQLKFSIGLRGYEGEHWHKKQWVTDFSSLIKNPAPDCADRNMR